MDEILTIERVIRERCGLYHPDAWYLGERIFKVIIRFQAVCFCSLRNAINDRTGFGIGNCIDHAPVLFPNTESPYRLFGKLSSYKDNFPKLECNTIISGDYRTKEEIAGGKDG